MDVSLNLLSLKALNNNSYKGIAIALSLLFTPLTHADEAAVKLLNRMNHALHELNYSGTLAYLRGNNLSSLRVEHSVLNGVKTERVVRLNEEGNEISRELEGFSLASITKIGPEMNAVYSFDMGRENRIANIPCRIITARPKDRERYLQKYCIDSVTGMLLDYMLVGKSHKPVEQFMFTSIEIQVPKKEFNEESRVQQQISEDVINNNVPSPIVAQVAPSVVTKNITKNIAAKAVQVKTEFRQLPDANLDDGWVIEALPAGFGISQAPSMKPINDSQGQVVETKHYIVSDGLSSLSLFVSPFTADAPVGAVKINSGALNVVSQKKGNHMITVVGEVPENTLRSIVDSLRKK